MYFSYLITYYDEEEQYREKIWHTFEVNEERTILTNDYGVKTSIKPFLRYKHHFHEFPLSDYHTDATSLFDKNKNDIR